MFSAFTVALFLLVMPCMNTTTVATRFLSQTHAALFLTLHRPAFSLFVAAIIVQYESGCWQQQFMSERYFLISFALIRSVRQAQSCFQALCLRHRDKVVRIIIRLHGPSSCVFPPHKFAPSCLWLTLCNRLFWVAPSLPWTAFSIANALFLWQWLPLFAAACAHSLHQTLSRVICTTRCSNADVFSCCRP